MTAVDAQRIEQAVREILLAIGEDPTRPGLTDTPRRVAVAYADFFGGLATDPYSHLGDAVPVGMAEGGNPATSDTGIVRNIEFRSVCEHHLLPFVGTAHAAYVPGDRGVGLGRVPAGLHTHARPPHLH